MLVHSATIRPGQKAASSGSLSRLDPAGDTRTFLQCFLVFFSLYITLQRREALQAQ